jgi:hypothetical protein
MRFTLRWWRVGKVRPLGGHYDAGSGPRLAISTVRFPVGKARPLDGALRQPSPRLTPNDGLIAKPPLVGKDRQPFGALRLANHRQGESAGGKSAGRTSQAARPGISTLLCR